MMICTNVRKTLGTIFSHTGIYRAKSRHVQTLERTYRTCASDNVTLPPLMTSSLSRRQQYHTVHPKIVIQKEKIKEYKENLDKLQQKWSSVFATHENSPCQPITRAKNYKHQSIDDVFNFFKANYKFLKIPAIEKEIQECSSYFRQLKGNNFMDQLLDDLEPKKNDLRDTIQAWKIIATVSCNKHIDWEHPRTNDFLNLMCDSTSHMSWAQLCESMRYLLFVYESERQASKPKLLQLLHHTLDQECSQRFKQKSEKSTELLEEKNRSGFLSLAFMWMRTCPDRNISSLNWTCRYTKSVIDFYLSKEMLEVLDHEEFVFLMYLVGMHRAYPNMSKKRNWKDHGAKIPLYLGVKLEQILKQASLFETDLICQSLNKAFLRLHIECGSVTNILIDKLITINDDEIFNNNYAINSICKLLLNRGSLNFDKMQFVVEKFIDCLPDLHPMTQIRLVLLVTDSRVYDYDHFVHRFATSIQDKFNQLRMKDLAMISHILFTANYTRDPYVFTKLCSALEKCDRSDPRSSLHIIYIISILIKMKMLVTQDINKLFDKVNDSKSLRSAVTKEQFVEAAVDVIFSLAPDSVYKNLQIREKRHSSHLYINGMRSLADLDWNIELDFPNYSGTRLNKDLRRKFLKISHPGEYANNTSGEKLRREILQDFMLLFGPHVHLKQLMPHYSTNDITLCLNQYRKKNLTTLQVFETEVGCNDDFELIPLDFSYGDWYAFVIPKASNLDVNGIPLGPAMHKIRQLESLGYRVIVIPQHVYMTKKAKGITHQYLQNLIYDAAAFIN